MRRWQCSGRSGRSTLHPERGRADDGGPSRRLVCTPIGIGGGLARKGVRFLPETRKA